MSDPGFEEGGCPHAVDYEHDVVAHEDCRDEEFLMSVVSADDVVEESASA